MNSIILCRYTIYYLFILFIYYYYYLFIPYCSPHLLSSCRVICWEKFCINAHCTLNPLIDHHRSDPESVGFWCCSRLISKFKSSGRGRQTVKYCVLLYWWEKDCIHDSDLPSCDWSVTHNRLWLYKQERSVITLIQGRSSGYVLTLWSRILDSAANDYKSCMGVQGNKGRGHSTSLKQG